MDTKIVTDDGTNAVHVDAGLNLVRLRDRVIITSGSPTDYNQSLYVSGSSLLYSGGNSHHTAAVVAVGDISGTTDGLFGRNLGVSGRTYLGTIDAAGDSYSADKILVAQGGGEIEYLTTAQLKADIGDADYWTATTDGTSISPSGSNTTTTVKMSGNTFIKGDLGVTGLTNSNELSAQTLTAKTFVNIGSEVNYLSIQNQYIKWKTSNRIFISSSPTSSAPNRLYDDWRLNDNDSLYFGTDNDLRIYHNGSNAYIDNNTGILNLTATNLYLGDGTSEVLVQDNLTVNDNLIVGDNITAGTDTFFVSATSGRTGIKTLSPDAVLSVKGGLGYQTYNLNGGNVSFSNGFARVLFANGASPSNLSSGDRIRFSDGSQTFTLTVDYIDGANLFLTQDYEGNNVTLTDEGLQFSSGESFTIPNPRR